MSPGSASLAKKTRQKMFVDKIAQLYNERLEKGIDSYESFNPDDILNFDPEKSTDKNILSQEADARWQSKDYKGARKYAGKYIKYHGLANKYTIYYAASLMPKPLIIGFAKLKRKMKKY
jgi:hypothetical protein